MYNLKKLESYDDANFYFVDRSLGKEFLVKFYNGVDTDNPDILNAYSGMLGILEDSKLMIPRIVTTNSGESFAFVENCDMIDGTKRTVAVRLFHWIVGFPLNDVGYNPSLLCDVGLTLGCMAVALKDFSHPAFKRKHAWDLKQFELSFPFVDCVQEPEVQKCIREVFIQFQEKVMADNGDLPQSIIMGDCNDANVIVEAGGNALAGIIDFGDAVHTWRVNEIAIALAYALLSPYGLQHPSATWACLLGGYCVVNPLTGVELTHLRTLVAVRLSISISVGAFSISKDPSNEYLKLHAVPAKSALVDLWTRDEATLVAFVHRISAQAAILRETAIDVNFSSINPALTSTLVDSFFTVH